MLVWARQAAKYILGEIPVPFAPQRMSAYACWYRDGGDGALVAVVPPDVKPSQPRLLHA